MMEVIKSKKVKYFHYIEYVSILKDINGNSYLALVLILMKSI